MASNKTWLLKILTGPHVGSEAMLSPGVYTLGEGDDCDIILHDSSLAERHFQLTASMDKMVLSILAEDHPCYIDGVEVTSDSSITIKPYQVISSGTFFFTLGYVGKAWPPIELLGSGRNFKQPHKQTANKQTAQQAVESDNEKPLSRMLALWQQLLSGDSSINRVHLSLGIALIGIGLSLLLVVLTASDISSGGLETEVADINQLIETYVIDATVDTTFVDGQKKFYIHGYTKTDEQRDAFMEALGKAGINVQTQLYSADKLRHAIAVILDQYIDAQTDTVEVSMMSGFPGQVILSGYVEQIDVWQRVLDTVKTDVPGLQDYDNRVWTMDDAVQTLEKMLASHELSDKVAINRVEHAIYLSSHPLSVAEQQRLAAISESYRAQYGDKPHLAYQQQGDPPIKKFGLSLGIQSISFGVSPYLQTEDGKRYTVGAIIDDGYTIKEINREFILLLKGGELGRHYFSEQP